jgi:hypothetical protein
MIPVFVEKTFLNDLQTEKAHQIKKNLSVLQRQYFHL